MVEHIGLALTAAFQWHIQAPRHAAMKRRAVNWHISDLSDSDAVTAVRLV